MVDLKTSNYIATSQTFFEDNINKRIIYSTIRGTVTIVSEEVYQWLIAEKYNFFSEKMLKDLCTKGYIVSRDHDEFNSVTSDNERGFLNDDVYLLTVMPSGNCQMGCSYCGQTHNSSQLSIEKQDEIIATVKKQFENGRYKNLHVSWYGGEPLIGVNHIKRMTGSLKSIPQKDYQAVMTTNGLMLNYELASELFSEYKVVLFQITLDGLSHTHNVRRPLKVGKGNFDLIVRNLKSLVPLLDLGLKIQIRCNVDSGNYHEVSELINLLAEGKLNHKNCKFYTRPVFDWDNGADRDALTPEVYARYQIEWLMKLEQLGFENELMPARVNGICKVYHSDNLLIDPSGDIYDCYEYPLVADPKSRNDARKGNISEGETVKYKKPIGEHYERLKDADHDCSICPMLPVCGGVCGPHYTKGIKKCPDFKFNIGERLLIYYQRIKSLN